jgi:hypothetical protein
LKDEIRFRATGKLHDAVRDYARHYGMTISAAARDLIRKQYRYWVWTQNREARGPSDDTLRHYGREALEKHPDLTKAQVAWNIARKAGRFVDSDAVDRVAKELVGG